MRSDVVPTHDAIEHDPEGDCVCGPDWRFCDGGVVVVHHSLDKREQYEATLPVTVAQMRRRIEESNGE